MSKHFSPDIFYDLPSGSKVHPQRLILRDGTIMWKHALLNPDGYIHIPQEQAHESHIIKTAQRLEDLNCWASQGLEPWDVLKPIAWDHIDHTHLPYAEGCACLLRHTTLPSALVLETLQPHIQEHEELKEVEGQLYFRRC